MKMPDDGFNGFGGGKGLGVDDQVRVVRGQIVGINADHGVDLSVLRLGVQSFRVAPGAGFDGTLDVDYNQVFDGIEDKAFGKLAGQKEGSIDVARRNRVLRIETFRQGNSEIPTGKLARVGMRLRNGP